MQRRSRRHGAVLIESAFTLPVFLLLVVGTLDFGLAVFRQHTIAAAARNGARMAIVHGNSADTDFGQWGPQMIDEPLSNTAAPEIIAAMRPPKSYMLVANDPTKTRVQVEWLDRSNFPGRRVRVTVSSPYRPFTPFVNFVFVKPEGYTLSASSTMTIAH
jgi:Flp pilus assembly protein TadG